MKIFELNHDIVRKILNQAFDSKLEEGKIEISENGKKYIGHFKQIKDEEIRRFAKNSCKVCSGTGLMRIIGVPKKDGTTQKVNIEVVCSCAIKRFVAKNQDCISYKDIWFRFSDIEEK